MSASARWRSKCPYNLDGDADDCTPCPHCDADNPQGVSQLVEGAAVGHVCDGWTAAKATVQSWLDKQGHERCWYYPELFNQLASALGLKAAVAPGLPSHTEFVEGCKRYQAEEYGKAVVHAPTADRLDGFAPVTHGPPQKVELSPPVPGACILLGPLPANNFALSALPTASSRKWPISTPDEHAWKLNSDGCRGDHGCDYEWHLRLQRARSHAKLTLDALGAKLTPPRTRKDISAMEHGRRGLSVELCAQLADALDCDRLWLAGWTLEGEGKL